MSQVSRCPDCGSIGLMHLMGCMRAPPGMVEQPSSKPSYVFCCGGDAKCAGGCECQCHGLTLEIDRLRAALGYVKLKATHLSEAQVAALNALRGADETDDVSRSRLKAASTPTTRDKTPVVQCGCAVTTDGLGNPGRLWCATHWLERDADKTKPPHEPDGCLDCLRAERSEKTSEGSK